MLFATFFFFEECSGVGFEVIKVVLKFTKRPKGMYLILKQVNYQLEKHVIQNQRSVTKEKCSANELNLSPQATISFWCAGLMSCHCIIYLCKSWLSLLDGKTLVWLTSWREKKNIWFFHFSSYLSHFLSCRWRCTCIFRVSCVCLLYRCVSMLISCHTSPPYLCVMEGDHPISSPP